MSVAAVVKPFDDFWVLAVAYGVSSLYISVVGGKFGYFSL
jgi:hypothetical protein